MAIERALREMGAPLIHPPFPSAKPAASATPAKPEKGLEPVRVADRLKAGLVKGLVKGRAKR